MKFVGKKKFKENLAETFRSIACFQQTIIQKRDEIRLRRIAKENQARLKKAKQ
jgi:hypothetical protein